jgi:hypothetical protein
MEKKSTWHLPDRDPVLAGTRAEFTHPQEIVDFYQPILGLQEWEIRAEWCSLHQIGAVHNHAQVETQTQKRRARILVAREEERMPCPVGFASDTEVNVVHELVHLRMASTWDEHDEWEIEATARALVHLRRRAL